MKAIVKVVIEFESTDLAVLAALGGLVDGNAGTMVDQDEEEAPTPTIQKPTAKKSSPKAKPARAKKAKEEESVSKEDVHLAMKEFIQATSVSAAKEVLERFSAKKLSDIDESSYGAVIEEFQIGG